MGLNVGKYYVRPMEHLQISGWHGAPLWKRLRLRNTTLKTSIGQKLIGDSPGYLWDVLSWRLGWM